MMPDTIHDYKIGQQIGEGSYGEVYKVQNFQEQDFALKIISVKGNKDNIKKQAELLAALDHPNILKAREFFFFNKEKYLIIIMQYCPKGSLENFIGQIRDNHSIKRILKGIAEGLVHLHSKNIIHRDIKPQNILMLNGVPKISDLGFSKVMETSKVYSLKGAQPYMALQIFQSQEYDKKADIWAFGIMALELFLGRRYNRITNNQKAPSKIEGFPSSAILDQIIDTEMREMVGLMLKKNPQERLSSQQVLDFLNGERGRKMQEEKLKKQTEQKNKLILENNKILLEEKQHLLKIVQQQQKLQSQLKKQKQIQYQQKVIIQKQASTQNQLYCFKKVIIQKQASTQNQLYRFNQSHKHPSISLQNNNTKAIHQSFRGWGHYLALVEGVLFQYPSSITFTITSINGDVAVGLAISNLIINNNYLFRNQQQIGHGCFLVFSNGYSFSHSHKEHNCVQTDFKYNQGDVIKVERNGDELCWRNQTRNKHFRMKVKLTADQWAQACFCVCLSGGFFWSSVQIKAGSSA